MTNIGIKGSSPGNQSETSEIVSSSEASESNSDHRTSEMRILYEVYRKISNVFTKERSLMADAALKDKDAVQVIRSVSVEKMP